jgi:hypothetical protein
MTHLAITTSPRMTWLWAPDEAAVQQMKLLLGDACGPAKRGREQLPLVVDIGIGVGAMTACETLAANDFTFTWHVLPAPATDPGRGCTASVACACRGGSMPLVPCRWRRPHLGWLAFV